MIHEELVEQLKVLIEDIRERKHISTLSRINYMRILTEVIEILIQNRPEILSLSKPREIAEEKLEKIIRAYFTKHSSTDSIFRIGRIAHAIATSKDIWKEEEK